MKPSDQSKAERILTDALLVIGALCLTFLVVLTVLEWRLQ